MKSREFQRLPLDAQLRWLEDHLESSDPLELLELCGTVRDSAPLTWLLGRLLRRGWLTDARHRAATASFLISRPDTVVHRVTRDLIDDVPEGHRDDLESLLRDTLERAPLSALTSICILDRALKHHFTATRDAFVTTVTAQVYDLVSAGNLHDLDPASLTKMSGDALPRLRAAASSAGVSKAFETLHRDTARRAIDILGDVPKGVSQANAEELLSTRVYTDPGHFLIELLQNAEDAGATRWRVTFQPDRIVVWHDGAAFDFRDVVGVTSIGQTTKRKSQIGFFGVGFKSIYEVTDRPQIYSDVFDFEIVDVSVPRWLGARPPDLPTEGTVLVLPLRDTVSVARSPRALFEKARQLDPCVLFTLRGIDDIELILGGDADGGPARWHIVESPPDDTGRANIRVSPGDETLRYIVHEETYAYEAGARGAGRPDSTPVMVGVRLDADGVPRPLAPNAPSIYSYLPTDERSGLRFFVQGHFDVPVDRERINPDSPWNRWLLEQVPRELRQIAEAAIASPDGYARGAGYLSVLPLARDLKSPIFEVVVDRLPAAFSDVPVVPCTDGSLHRARQTMLAHPSVSKLFEGRPIPTPWLRAALLRGGLRDRPAQMYLATPDLPDRGLEVARHLGAADFRLDDLVDVIAATVGPENDAGPLPGLASGDISFIRRLYDVLAEGLAGAHGRTHPLLSHRLRKLPLVPDSRGALFAPDEIFRGTEQIRDVCQGRHAFVHPDLDPKRTDEKERDPHDSNAATNLLERLRVRVFTIADLVADLEEAPTWYTDAESRRHALLRILDDAERRLQVRASRAPIFRATDGVLYPAAQHADDRDGVFVVPQTPVGEELRELYGGIRPLADPGHHLDLRLLARVDAPELSIRMLVSDVRSGALVEFDSVDIRRIHAALDALRAHLSDRDRDELARAAIWPDRSGVLRSLRGESAAQVATDSEIPTLLRDVPFLDPGIAEMAHAIPIAGRTVGPADVVRVLRSSDDGATAPNTRPEVTRLLRYLAHRASDMPQQAALAISSIALFFPAAEGDPLPLADTIDADGNAVHSCSPNVRELFEEAGLPVLSAESRSAAAPLFELGLAGELDVADLYTHLAHAPTGSDVFLTRRLLPRVREVLVDAVSDEQLVDLPLVTTVGGEVRRAAECVADPEVLNLFAPGSDVRETISRRVPDEASESFVAHLTHLAFDPASHLEVIDALSTPATVATHPHLSDPARRGALYRWLTAHEGELFTDEACRDALRNAALFPTSNGSLLPPTKLILDEAMPDLGIDWAPADEIPSAVLSLLSRHLEVGTARFDALLDDHLLPALRASVESEDIDRQVALTNYIAQRAIRERDAEIRSLLRRNVRFLTRGGQFVEPSQLLLPSEIAPDIETLWGRGASLLADVYSTDVESLARWLGSRELPDFGRLARRLHGNVRDAEQSESAAVLLARRSPDPGQARELSSAEWVVSESGQIAAPEELFLRGLLVETLIGEAPRHYASADVTHHLDDETLAALGFKGPSDVTVDDVVANLRERSANADPVRMSLYTWLDDGLVEGRIRADELRDALDDFSWVFTDDERYFHHSQVLGTREMELFGNRRGYWTRGREECPRLFDVFDIEEEATARGVVSFLRDVGQRAAPDDRALLRDDPALRRMLVACYAFLGESSILTAVSRDLPILCRARGLEDEERLLPARTKKLVRSDTPTLEAMFEKVGSFYVAVQGSDDQSDAVDRFYDRVGIRRLREAYEVKVATDSGADRTAQFGVPLGRFAGILRALTGVLPRVATQRGGHRQAWVFDERLTDVIDRHAISAIEDLRVTFVLEDVGEVEEKVEAAYDPETKQLYLDTDVLQRPGAHATGIALGILPCVYDGPAEDQVVDILVILLPMQTREKMDAYLDSRHFPVASAARTPAQRVQERLHEVLDFGLDRRLSARFDQLRGRDLSRWRDEGIAERAVSDGGEVTRHGVALLLDAVGVTSPNDDLLDAMTAVLEAPGIDAIPAEVLRAPQSKAAMRERDGRQESWQQATGQLPEISARHEDQTYAPLPGEPQHVSGSGDLPARPRTAGSDASAPSFEPAVRAPRRDSEPFDPDAILAGIDEMMAETADDGRANDGAARNTVPRTEQAGGLWSTVKGWLGMKDSPSVRPAEPSPWTFEENPFQPQRGIGSQLWVTGERLRALSEAAPEDQLRFSPGSLPRPHLYAVRNFGATFDPAQQRWTDEGLPAHDTLASGLPTGRTVQFEGVVGPGTSQLPVPLFAALAEPPMATDDGTPLAVRRRADGTWWVEPPDRVSIRYRVILARVPALRDATVERTALAKPTTERKRFPTEVRQWLGAPPVGAPWEVARRAEAFVTRRYLYDADFLSRPRVARAVERLEPGRGQHHLELMHAAGDGHVLGRGVCYELNLMVVELLRHLGIPSMVATGWVLDRGVIDRADHLFALAVVASTEGPCLLPLDASVDPAGQPIRTAPSGARSAAESLPGPGGAWESSGEAPVQISTVREHEERRAAEEASSVIRAALIACDHAGEKPPEWLETAGQETESLERAWDAGVEWLGDASLFSTLAAAVAGNIRDAEFITPQIEELAQRGLVRVVSEPRYAVEALETGS